jgi:D-allulose-6-phosphate 3-epimerase
MAIKIAPSLICMDLLQVGEQIQTLNGCADVLHCDMSDDHFAPALGLPLDFLRAIRTIATIPVDVHLMLEHVAKAVEEILPVGAGMITLPLEGITSNAFRIIRRIRDAGVGVGVALNPATPIENLKCVLPSVDKVTVLMFDPGVAGQSLVPVTLEKVSALARLRQAMAGTFVIEVDGSCNAKNFGAMKNVGADQYVVGTSGLFSLDRDLGRAWRLMNDYMQVDASPR